jgi:hypothetical protein
MSDTRDLPGAIGRETGTPAREGWNPRSSGRGVVKTIKRNRGAVSAASNVLVTIDGAWSAVIRPAETSVAAACMTVRARVVSQGSGRSARKAPDCWPRSISAKTRPSTGSCAARMRSGGSSRSAAVSTFLNWSTICQLPATSLATASRGSPEMSTASSASCACATVRVITASTSSARVGKWP